jgi:hypothetical protein
MGPAAWAAVSRALVLALTTSALTKRNNVIAITARSVYRAIQNNELEMAEATLRDLAFRHRKSFQEFMRKYKDELPKEMFEEFSEFL